MYAFVIFLGLALGLTVVMQVIDELVPVKVPTALTRTLAVAFAAGFAWLLDYSVFTSFGQDLRAPLVVANRSDERVDERSASQRAPQALVVEHAVSAFERASAHGHHVDGERGGQARRMPGDVVDPRAVGSCPGGVRPDPHHPKRHGCAGCGKRARSRTATDDRDIVIGREVAHPAAVPASMRAMRRNCSTMSGVA